MINNFQVNEEREKVCINYFKELKYFVFCILKIRINNLEVIGILRLGESEINN